MPDYGFSFGASMATTPAVIASAGSDTAAIGLSFGAAPSLSVMFLPNKGAESKAMASVPAFLFGVLRVVRRHPRPPPVFALASAPALSFGTGIYRSRGRGGRSFQPSARHFPPPYLKWWGKEGPSDDIWRKY